MPLYMHLRLLHAWWDVPDDDGKGRPREIVLLTTIQNWAIQVPRCLHVFSVSA